MQPRQIAMSKEQITLNQKRLAQTQMIQDFESRKKSLLSAMSTAGTDTDTGAASASPQSVLLRLVVLLSNDLIACGVQPRQDVHVSSDVTLYQLRQFVSALSDEPIDAFDIRSIEPTLAAPFTDVSRSRSIQQLGLTDGDVVLAQVARKGHVRPEWKEVAAEVSWLQQQQHLRRQGCLRGLGRHHRGLATFVEVALDRYLLLP